MFVDSSGYIDYHLYVMLKDMCSKCFHSLGVSSRMKIYTFLKTKKASTVSEIVDIAGLTQPTVSYHLKEMEEVGLLVSKKIGKEVYYQIGGECTTCVLKNA